MFGNTRRKTDIRQPPLAHNRQMRRSQREPKKSLSHKQNELFDDTILVFPDTQPGEILKKSYNEFVFCDFTFNRSPDFLTSQKALYNNE